MQEHLLELYFTYVHAQLPILHKKAFMDTFRKGLVPVMLLFEEILAESRVCAATLRA